jgi:hypothetical protein
MLKRVLVLAVLAALTCAAATSLSAQADFRKTLVGKWEGDVQDPGAKKNTQRTLVIQSVAGDTWKGRFGPSGEGLSQVSGEIDGTSKPPTLMFETKGGSHVTLQLLDSKNLQGTIRYRGTGPRLQDMPLRLAKTP